MKVLPTPVSRMSFLQQRRDPRKRAAINMCQAWILYWEASVCSTVKVWSMGGGLRKRSTKEHDWAITSCFCFPALPVFNEVWPVHSQWYIKAACNSRIGKAGVIEYAGTFISQQGTTGVSLLTSSSTSCQTWYAQEINKLYFSKTICLVFWKTNM